MASSLKGARELRARLRAIKTAWKPVGRTWADDTATEIRRDAQFKDRTGKGRRSVKRKNASMTRASVAAIYYVTILDKGTKGYTIKPRKAPTLVFNIGGRPVFAKKVTRRPTPGMRFAEKASREALRKNPLAKTLIAQWNRAA